MGKHEGRSHASKKPIQLTTTGMHLGRAIAGALGRRFRDRVTIQYPPDESRIRVTLEH